MYGRVTLMPDTGSGMGGARARARARARAPYHGHPEKRRVDGWWRYMHMYGVSARTGLPGLAGRMGANPRVLDHNNRNGIFWCRKWPFRPFSAIFRHLDETPVPERTS